MAHIEDKIIPKGALPLVFAIVGFALTVVTVGVMMPAEAKRSPVADAVRSAELRFADMPDGGIAVTSAAGTTVLPADSNGFIRGALRAMARERKVHAMGPEEAFVLALDGKGKLTLVDPAVGTVINLRAFGADNAAAFAAFLPPAATATAAPRATASIANIAKGE
jgi:putative photosynthetic complex assembly protein